MSKLFVRLFFWSVFPTLLTGFSGFSANPYYTFRWNIAAVWSFGFLLSILLYSVTQPYLLCEKFPGKAALFVPAALVYMFIRSVFTENSGAGLKYAVFLSALFIALWLNKEYSFFQKKVLYLNFFILFPLVLSYAAIQYMGYEPLYQTDSHDAQRVFSFFGGKNMFAFYLVLTVVWMDGIHNRTLLMAGLFPVIFYLRSRVAWISAVFVAVNGFSKPRIRVILPAGIMLVAALYFSFSQHSSTVYQRLFIYKAALLETADNPIFGIGPGNFIIKYEEFREHYIKNWRKGFIPPPQKARLVHNDWLQFMSEYGVIGLFLFLSAIIQLGILQKKNSMILLGLVVLIHSMVSFPLQIPVFIWMIAFSAGRNLTEHTSRIKHTVLIFILVPFFIFGGVTWAIAVRNICADHWLGCYLATGKYGFLKKAVLCAEPEDTRIFYEAGTFFLKQHEYENAEKMLRQAAWFPEDSIIFYRLSQALKLQGKNREALFLLKKSVERNPLNFQAQYSYLKEISEDQEKYRKHCEILRSMFRDNPQYFKSEDAQNIIDML